MAANFGDTGAHWSPIDPALLAKHILEAYQQQSTDKEWVARVLDERLAAPKSLRNWRRSTSEQSRGARAGVGGGGAGQVKCAVGQVVAVKAPTGDSWPGASL